MRRLLVPAVILCLAASGRGGDDAKHNRLTQKEIDEGWILLFDGETTFGWRSPNDSKWTIADGMLAPQADKPGVLVTTSAFRDCDLHFDFQLRGDSNVTLIVGSDADGKAGADDDSFVWKSHTWTLPTFVGRGWWRAQVAVRGGLIVGQEIRSTDGRPAFAPGRRKNDKEPVARAGQIAFTGNGFIFRNVKLKPVDGESLFNAKGLARWKEFPDKKTKFTVTKEGWLNLKDGPGDLQTEGQWADFVLQLECISNGDHCNSGVFFRCRPGEYQQGYEAQIRNEFHAEADQEYTLEIYDPKSNELKDKKKEKFTAVDYGTGGIYRRAPARRELSKDREWFAMTVVANGRHLAVWVNGVQATDWTDDRPLADNARKGCYLEKGPISLQGHDATTDLSFRNIRIFDFEPAKEEKKEP
jgi:hypothetical protein